MGKHYTRTMTYRRLAAERRSLLHEQGALAANRARINHINAKIADGYWRHVNPEGGWRIADRNGAIVDLAGIPRFADHDEARAWIDRNSPAGWAPFFAPVWVPADEGSAA